MLEESLVQQPTLIWNSARGVWEKPMASLLCEHWELFSEAWPTSGMMRNGQVFELQMQERHTADTESSSQQQKLPTPTTMDAKATNNPDVIDKFLLQGKQTCLSYELLRSPKASKGQGGALGEQEALRRGNTVGVRDQVMDLVASQGLKVSRVADNLLPTPNTMEHLPARTGEARERQLYRGGSESKRSSSGNLREDILDLIPTPTTRDYKDGQAQHKRDGVVQTDTVARAVFNSGEVTMLPTPQVDDSKNTGHNQDRRVTLASEVWATEKTTNWGKFQPAILRWEQTLGIAAPAPTKPDGKESAHRLSSEFTEWMMGLEPGWITDCGLTRNEELKAAGNGVVPQQAELALRILLGLDIPKALERERERELIPTPTVFHVSMHDEPIETFLTRQAKSSTGQIGKSLGVALRMELDK